MFIFTVEAPNTTHPKRTNTLSTLPNLAKNRQHCLVEIIKK
jgi:hypothetical protein